MGRRNIRIEKFCDICGSKFTIPPCWEGRVKRCSLKCKHKAMEGKNNWNYKNGKTVSKYGYILINNYPFKIFEHRKIVEEYLGIKLKDSEIVHHKNGIKDDNRIENLEIMTRSQHNILHNIYRNRDEGGRFLSKMQ